VSRFFIVRTYSDAGRSGLRLKDRPELMRLLTDVTSGKATFKAVRRGHQTGHGPIYPGVQDSITEDQ